MIYFGFESATFDCRLLFIFPLLPQPSHHVKRWALALVFGLLSEAEPLSKVRLMLFKGSERV